MAGRTPKPPGQRRRRNAGQSEWQELPDEGRQGEAPEPRTDRQLGEIAQRYWETLWASPMAVNFTEADIQSLTRLAVLVDDRARADSGDGLIEIIDTWHDGSELRVLVGEFKGDGEIRQLEDRFGVSPLARRRGNRPGATCGRSRRTSRCRGGARRFRGVPDAWLCGGGLD